MGKHMTWAVKVVAQQLRDTVVWCHVSKRSRKPSDSVRPNHGLLKEAFPADIHGHLHLQKAVPSDAGILNKALGAYLHPPLAAGLGLPCFGQKPFLSCSSVKSHWIQKY